MLGTHTVVVARTEEMEGIVLHAYNHYLQEIEQEIEAGGCLCTQEQPGMHG